MAPAPRWERVPTRGSMHIPDNYLGPATCAILAAAMVPVRTVSIRKAQAGLEGGFEKSLKGRHCFVLPQ